MTRQEIVSNIMHGFDDIESMKDGPSPVDIQNAMDDYIDAGLDPETAEADLRSAMASKYAAWLQDELYEAFEEFDGPARLHISAVSTEPKMFESYSDAIAELASLAVQVGWTAKQAERMAFIIPESEYQAELALKVSE